MLLRSLRIPKSPGFRPVNVCTLPNTFAVFQEARRKDMAKGVILGHLCDAGYGACNDLARALQSRHGA